jgi:predicted nucleic acid-binding protein
MKIEEALGGISRLAFDTAPIIYFVEANPTYDALVSNIFNRIASGVIEGRTSVISLSEVLVRPILERRSDLQNAYRELLLKSSNFQTLAIDAMVAENAARLRAVHGLRLPDALQVAFAIESGCQAIVCNDHLMRRVTELPVDPG